MIMSALVPDGGGAFGGCGTTSIRVLPRLSPTAINCCGPKLPVRLSEAKVAPLLPSTSDSTPALALVCDHTAWSPVANDVKAKSIASPATAPAMLPPIWLLALSSRSVAPAPAKVTLPLTNSPPASSSVPASITVPPV